MHVNLSNSSKSKFQIFRAKLRIKNSEYDNKKIFQKGNKLRELTTTCRYIKINKKNEGG